MLSALPLFLSAQSGNFGFNPEKHNVISLDANLEVNSTAVTNQFMYDFYNGKFLTDELKKDNSARMKDYNLLGYRFDAALTFRVSDTANRNSGFFGTLEQHDRIELSFDKEFFDLYFFGNAQYTDQFVHINNVGMNMITYQQLKAGFYESFGKDNRHTLGLAVGFVKGQKNLDVDVKQATLFTQKDAMFIALDADMSLRRSDSASSDLKAMNGAGASVDVFWSVTDNHKNNFRISLSDLGFIKWSSRSQQYSRDTLYHFDGFEVKDMLDIGATTFTGKTKDSILNEFSFADKHGTYDMWLPMQFNISYNRLFLKDRFLLSAMVRHEFFSKYKPQVIIKPAYCYRWKKSELRLAAILMMRGYGTFNAGAEITANIANSFFLQLGTGYLNAYLNPQNAAGIGGYFSIAKSF